MADTEKVIIGLEQVKKDIAEVFVSGSQIAVDTLKINKAIELLKETEKMLRKTAGDNEIPLKW